MFEDAITSKAYVREIGKRIKELRINRELTQKDLADKSGVSLRSISRFEQGEDIQLGNFIKILKALDLQDNLELLVPDVASYPLYQLQKKPRQRIRKKTVKKSGFKWGDET